METGSAILKWTKSYKYTGTMSRDKMSMSGTLKLYEFWDTGDSQTSYPDWSAVRTSGLNSESDSDESDTSP